MKAESRNVMPTSSLISVAEFAALDALDHERVELVHGEIISMSPVRLKHSMITARLIFYLQSWINGGAGGLVGTELGFILDEDTIRAADMYYLSPEQCVHVGDHDAFGKVRQR